jgi:membrane protein implicated in regulation of membrane protease activity
MDRHDGYIAPSAFNFQAIIFILLVGFLFWVFPTPTIFVVFIKFAIASVVALSLGYFIFRKVFPNEKEEENDD